MSEAHARWTDQLSDYLDGGLAEDDRQVLEVHLAGCDSCRLLMAELSAVIDAAASLPDLEPTRDVWPEIAAGIGDLGVSRIGYGNADVIELPVRADARRPTRARGVFLSMPQLAAAAVLLILLSGAATWFAGPGLAVRNVQQLIPSPLSVTMASDDPTPPEALASELAALEDVLARARVVLDPNTVRVLERNLAVVEQAIEDSYRALALDPENEFLVGYLERVFERKLEYLRDVERVVEWAG